MTKLLSAYPVYAIHAVRSYVSHSFVRDKALAKDSCTKLSKIDDRRSEGGEITFGETIANRRMHPETPLDRTHFAKGQRTSLYLSA